MQKKIFFLAATTALVSANAQEKIMVDGHEAVDLGLSVLWATCNVGADSPEKPGDYFAFGEIEPKTEYTEANYEFSGTEIDADHDAATQKWGKNWRMPTKEEWDDLQKLEWEKNGIGFNVKGNGNSIFLPFTGNRYDDKIRFETTDGYYRSRSMLNESEMWRVNFTNNRIKNNEDIINISDVYYLGMAIRAVCDKPDPSINYVEKENANTVYKIFENGQIVIVKNGVKYNLAGQKL